MILGPGGREHALAQTLIKSSEVETIYVTPGNDGMAQEITPSKRIEVLGISEIPQILSFAKNKNIELTIVGSEEYLAKGIVDLFQKEGLSILGPTQKASSLESSKEFSKNLMKELNIPTALFFSCSDLEKAIHTLEQISNIVNEKGIVVKASPLAAGKGVFVCSNYQEAFDALHILHDKNLFPVIIEEKLLGKELSFFTLCSKEDYRFLGHACDYKRLKNNNLGPNTGGMGAYSPCDWLKENEKKEIEEKVILPLLKGMNEKNIPYSGFLFTGIMMTENGPMVLEFNARLGDPETQALLPLIDEDILPWLNAVAKNELHLMPKREIKKKSLTSVHVVMASKNYPHKSSNSTKITYEQHLLQNSILTFSGVKRVNDNQLYTNGGRVLGLTVLGPNRKIATREVYQKIQHITFEGAQHREDIGK